MREGKIERRRAGGGMLVGGREDVVAGFGGAAMLVVDFGRLGMVVVGVVVGATLSKSSQASSSWTTCVVDCLFCGVASVVWTVFCDDAHCEAVSSKPSRSRPRASPEDLAAFFVESFAFGGSALPLSKVPQSSSSPSSWLSLRLSASNNTSRFLAGAYAEEFFLSLFGTRFTSFLGKSGRGSADACGF